MHALADEVCQPAYGEDVFGSIEGEAVSGIEAGAGVDLGGNGLEEGVVGAEALHGLMIAEFA